MKLKAYFKLTGETPSSFSLKVGRTPKQIRDWLSGVMPRSLSRDRKPIGKIIFEETKGAVTLNDW